MAASARKISNIKKSAENVENTKVSDAEEKTTNTDASVVIVEENKVSEPKKEKKKFNDADLIPCLCVFPGSVGMTGRRSGNTYLWEDMSVIEYVEYQDLKSEVLNKKSAYIYEPLIIIDDEDFLAQYPNLAKMYKEFYTPDEIMDKIADSDPADMKKFINSLPSGIKANIKNIAATMIQEGTLDSMKKIKIIDEIFGTELSTNSQF